MKMKEFGLNPLSLQPCLFSRAHMEEGRLLNSTRALNFTLVTKEKIITGEIIVYMSGFWLTRRFCGWWGQSLGNQARDCGCFSMQ